MLNHPPLRTLTDAELDQIRDEASALINTVDDVAMERVLKVEAEQAAKRAELGTKAR
ncbi:hypothetical protein SAMN04488012_101321 [Palleronia salina]|uniref:Uncharacterized protein n=1 Tax=Palleronia salina TaxID=313368 RepID=A0A1M6B1B5_9RHOB|nr:hypothetical protein [Palleronia salina]SHI42398.1 hypothetical protein SAMN04488012_101321 [Palleronia salina]